MDDRTLHERIQCLADGELSPDEARELRDWLENDPRAFEVYRGILRLKALVGRSLGSTAAPAELRRSIEASLRDPIPVTRLRPLRWVAAAVIAVGVILVFYAPFRTPPATFAHEALVERCVEEHCRSVEPGELRAASDQETAAIRHALADLDLPMREVPRISTPNGLALYCGASRYRCASLGIAGARLIYEDPEAKSGSHKRFSVYVFRIDRKQLEPGLLKKLQCEKGLICKASNGSRYTVCCRVQDGLLVQIVGDVPAEDYEERYKLYFCDRGL